LNYRDKASFGKRQEYVVIAELLKRNFDVYQTLVDDQGIDCILRMDNQTYIDIQIKVRSKDALRPNFFASLMFEPRDNYFFIFYIEKDGDYYTMPSKDVVKYASTITKEGKNKGKMSIVVPLKTKLEEFSHYR